MNRLKRENRRQDEKIAALEATQETQADNQLFQLRLINDLKKTTKEPGKTVISRAEKIEKYLSSRPDHKATFEMLKWLLRVDNVRLNEAIKILIDTSDRSYSVQKATTGDKRKRVINLKSGSSHSKPKYSRDFLG